MWHDTMMQGWPSWGSIMGWVIWIAFIIAVITIIARLSKGPMKNRAEDKNIPFENENTSDSPQEILQRRYAEGQIDSQEFEEKMEQLKKSDRK